MVPSTRFKVSWSLFGAIFILILVSGLVVFSRPSPSILEPMTETTNKTHHHERVGLSSQSFIETETTSETHSIQTEE